MHAIDYLLSQPAIKAHVPTRRFGPGGLMCLAAVALPFAILGVLLHYNLYLWAQMDGLVISAAVTFASWRFMGKPLRPQPNSPRFLAFVVVAAVTASMVLIVANTLFTTGGAVHH
jgi:hypothetical protein